MQFQFPFHEGRSRKEPVPPLYRKYFIPHLPVRRYSGGGGDFIVQTIGYPSFQIQLQLLSCSKPYALAPHLHQTKVVLFYLPEGHFSYRPDREKPIEVHPGFYCLFVFPGERHRQEISYSPVLWLAPGRYASFHVEFMPSFFRAYMRETPVEDTPGFSSRMMEIGPATRSAIRDVRHCPEDETQQALYLNIRVQTLLLQYLRDRQAPNQNPNPSLSLAEAVSTYIREHLGEAPTVQMLARQFYLSPSTLRRYFLQQFGMPVHRYVFGQQMARARELLEQQGAPIHLAASETGFSDLSSFSRAFTRFYGHPPSYFRKSGGNKSS